MSSSSTRSVRSFVEGGTRSSSSTSTNNTNTESKTKPDANTSSLSNYLETFFTTAYFLYLCPFRIKRDQGQSEKLFKITTWWPQRVVCAILTLLSLLWLLRGIRVSLPSGGQGPAGYVQLVLSLITAINKLVVIVKLWFDRESFLQIANFVSNQYTQVRWANKRWLIGVIYTIMGLALFLTIRGLDAYGGIVHGWTWTRWQHSLVYAGRYNFFLSRQPFPLLCNSTMHVVLDSEVNDYVQHVDIILVILTILGSFSHHMMSTFSDFLMLMVTMTLWTATKMYCSKVKIGSRKPEVAAVLTVEGNYNGGAKVVDDENGINGGAMETKVGDDVVSIEVEQVSTAEWKEIYEGFSYLKKLADLINKTMGLYVSTSIVENVLYYAVFFDLVFAENNSYTDWGRRLALLFFLASTCAIFFLCADLSHRISALKSWLSVEENRKNVPTDLVVLLINQVDSRNVAIKASKIFPITYQTLTGMLGVTATYFILCVRDKTLAQNMFKC